VAPDCRVIHVTAEETVDRRSREEFHRFAAVVAARQAWLTFVADDVGFDGYSIARLQHFNVRRNGDNHSSGFMTQNVVTSNDHWTNTPGMPEMDIGPEEIQRMVSSIRGSLVQLSSVDGRETRGELYPQIPVLRTSTVTSPGFSELPLLTSSSVGVASAIHRSCLGLVKTPILASEGDELSGAIASLTNFGIRNRWRKERLRVSPRFDQLSCQA
jgi:hypothetical protein